MGARAIHIHTCAYTSTCVKIAKKQKENMFANMNYC